MEVLEEKTKPIKCLGQRTNITSLKSLNSKFKIKNKFIQISCLTLMEDMY